MKISTNTWIDKLAWLLTVCLISSFLIFYTETWGRYVYLALSAMLAMLGALKNGGVLKLRLEPFYIWSVLFVLFVFASSLWAKYDSGQSTSSGVTLLLTVLCMVMVYLYYQTQRDIHSLLTAIMWGGYVVAAYTLITYGYDTLTEMAAAANQRMENDFANVNSIGMLSAYACIFQVHELLYKRRPWTALLMIPAILVIAATQSRKALVLVVCGIAAIYVMKNLQNRDRLRGFLKVVLFLVISVAVVSFLMEQPMFAGVRERMEALIGFVTGEEEAGASTKVRTEMVKLGLEIFQKNPIGGIGIANAQYELYQNLGMFTYLHNNYVELLANGGLLGFVLYYIAHFYLLRRLFRYRKADREAFALGFVWLGAILAIDFGMVSYPDKIHWVYMLAQFLNVQCLKQKYEEQQYESQKAMEQRN